MAAKAPRPMTGSPGVQDWTGSRAGRDSTGVSPSVGRDDLARHQAAVTPAVKNNDALPGGDKSGGAEKYD